MDGLKSYRIAFEYPDADGVEMNYGLQSRVQSGQHVRHFEVSADSFRDL
jgi:hypothetical protein